MVNEYNFTLQKKLFFSFILSKSDQNDITNLFLLEEGYFIDKDDRTSSLHFIQSSFINRHFSPSYSILS